MATESFRSRLESTELFGKPIYRFCWRTSTNKHLVSRLAEQLL
jgi:hypothetical protein